MKQMEVHQKQIGEHTFYIRPFSALKAAVISGDLTSIIGPVLGELGGALDGIAGEKGSIKEIKDVNIEDIEIGAVLPSIGSALSKLGGSQVERLIRELLIDEGNVAVDNGTGGTVVLNVDTLNEAFCGEIQDMFALCFEVIKVNFSGFFTKLLTRFGSQPATMETESLASGASSM